MSVRSGSRTRSCAGGIATQAPGPGTWTSSGDHRHSGGYCSPYSHCQGVGGEMAFHTSNDPPPAPLSGGGWPDWGSGPPPSAGLGIVRGTSSLHTELAPGNPGCSQ
eukprot:8900801-Pyramimonas_sp.AAC.2